MESSGSLTGLWGDSPCYASLLDAFHEPLHEGTVTTTSGLVVSCPGNQSIAMSRTG